jgi:hypothetical protein
MKKEKKTLPEPVPTIQIDSPLAIESSPSSSANKDFDRITRKWYVSIVLFVFFICANGAVWYWYINTVLPVKRPAVVPVNTTSPRAISSSPTPVKEPISIAVWNGSGIGGEARRVADILKKSGYTIIEVSNAQAVQVGSTLFLSSSVVAREEEIKKDLLKLEITVEQVKPLLKREGEYEALLIVGR